METPCLPQEMLITGTRVRFQGELHVFPVLSLLLNHNFFFFVAYFPLILLKAPWGTRRGGDVWSTGCPRDIMLYCSLAINEIFCDSLRGGQIGLFYSLSVLLRVIKELTLEALAEDEVCCSCAFTITVGCAVTPGLEQSK